MRGGPMRPLLLDTFLSAFAPRPGPQCPRHVPPVQRAVEKGGVAAVEFIFERLSVVAVKQILLDIHVRGWQVHPGEVRQGRNAHRGTHVDPDHAGPIGVGIATVATRCLKVSPSARSACPGRCRRRRTSSRGRRSAGRTPRCGRRTAARRGAGSTRRGCRRGRRCRGRR